MDDSAAGRDLGGVHSTIVAPDGSRAGRSSERPLRLLCNPNILAGLIVFVSIQWWSLAGGQLFYVADWFWASLRPVEPLNAGRIAVAAIFLNYMGITSFTQTGVVDMRNNSGLFAPRIDISDGNLAKALIERNTSRMQDDLVVRVNDLVDEHIDRIQTNSLLWMNWKERTEYDMWEYKLHSFGCLLWVGWLRWSAAWHVDYGTRECDAMTTFDSGTKMDIAILADRNKTDLSPFDSNGPVNAEWACLQSRSLNNMQLVKQLEGQQGIKFSRYSLGGTANRFVDLESFTEDVGSRQATVHEVRSVFKYEGTSTDWSSHGHLSVLMDLQQDEKEDHPADAEWLEGLGKCADNLLHDRSRLRRKAVSMAEVKAREAMDASGKPTLPATQMATILAAGATAIVAVLTTSPKVGDLCFGKLKDRSIRLPVVESIAVLAEWASQLVFTTPLHVVLAHEVKRQLHNTVQSAVYITTTEFGETEGLYWETPTNTTTEVHVLSMVQVSRKANPTALVVAVMLEVIVLVLGLSYLLGPRRKALRASVVGQSKKNEAESIETGCA